MVEKKEVVIRHFREGDEKQINKLFNRVFETDRPLAVWRWKFQQNPARLTDPARIVLGESDGKIVSQYPAIARDLWMCGESRNTIQIVDNLIDPDYRAGRNLQKQMVNYYGDRALAHGNDFTFGCPNDIHYRVGKRILGYDDLFSVPRLFCRLSPRLALRQRLPQSLRLITDAISSLSAKVIRIALRTGNEYRYLIAKNIDERFDNLWNLAKARFILIGVRDRKYLHWRYELRPDAVFRVLCAEDDEGMKAWIILNVTQKPDGSRVGYVTDFLYLDESVMKQLIRRGLCELSRMGADFAIAIAAPGSAGETLLRSAGFDERKGFEPVRMVRRWYNMLDLPSQSVVLNPVNWHLCHGDLDLDL